jgi:hypothetical protein
MQVLAGCIAPALIISVITLVVFHRMISPAGSAQIFAHQVVDFVAAKQLAFEKDFSKAQYRGGIALDIGFGLATQQPLVPFPNLIPDMLGTWHFDPPEGLGRAVTVLN